MVRAFIGIFVPEDLRKRIEKIQKELLSLPIRAKLVERENLHITLSFLGQVSEHEINEIISKLLNICNQFDKFEVKIGKLIPIPTQTFIRVIAFEVESQKLIELSEKIRKEIGGDVKPPHLTICRVKFVGNKEKVLDWIKDKLLDECFLVERVDLIKSELTRKGPKYSIIHSAFLRS